MGSFKIFLEGIEYLTVVWFTGIVLILIGVFVLGVLIPFKDRGINEKRKGIAKLEHKRDVLLGDNWKDYQNYMIKEKMARLTTLFLQSANASQEAINASHDEYREARRDAIGKLFIISTGSLPPSEATNRWNEMTIEQLLEEDKKMRPKAKENIDKLLAKINEEKLTLGLSENSKTNLIITASIIQVIGLVLINTASFFKGALK